MRAPSEIVDAARAVARERDVPLFDAENALAALSPARAPGREWIVDTLHPTAEGYRTLGLALLDLLVAKRLIPFAEGPAADAGSSSLEPPASRSTVAGRLLGRIPPIPRDDEDAGTIAYARELAVVSDAGFALLVGNPGACRRMLAEVREDGDLRKWAHRRALVLRAILARHDGDDARFESLRAALLRGDPEIRTRGRESGTRRVFGIPEPARAGQERDAGGRPPEGGPTGPITDEPVGSTE
jgi:hypothetical protein